MILCPNCHHEEIPGALFCSECGARLVLPEKPQTAFLKKAMGDSGSLSDRPPVAIPGTKPFGIDAVLSLSILDSAQMIHLTGQTEFSLGRSMEGQSILPDVDLSPYEAYAQGVSRLHATLKIVDNNVYVCDLGSSNGTRLNGVKITPHTDMKVNHGDVITLGKLKIQVLVRKQ